MKRLRVRTEIHRGMGKAGRKPVGVRNYRLAVAVTAVSIGMAFPAYADGLTVTDAAIKTMLNSTIDVVFLIFSVGIAVMGAFQLIPAINHFRTEQLPADFHRVQWKEEHTKFFKDSWELHERYARTVHGRHCDNCEKMARAFECYVADKLEQEESQSPYLTAHSENAIFVKETGEKVYGGPVGREREEINRMFDVMFWELKEMGVLHWRRRGLKDVKKINIRD